MSGAIYHGDPAAMRGQAAAARLKAEQISALGRRLLARAQSIDFAGPAATDFRAAMLDRTQQAEGAAAALNDAASLLLSAAAYAEAELARVAQVARESEAGRTGDW